MPAETVRKLLMSHGIAYATHEHPVGYSAQRTAQQEGVAGAGFAKPVMLMADDDLVMVVLPATEMVDLEKAEALLGADSVRLASEDEFTPAFPDCERGAEPPFGALYGVGTIVDERLSADEITFPAGTHTVCITMARADYVRVTNPRIVDIAIGSLTGAV